MPRRLFQFPNTKIQVKIWDLSVFAGDDVSKSISTPTLSVDLGPNRVVECIATHKTAEGILGLGYGSSAAIVDVGAQTVAIGKCKNFFLLTHFPFRALDERRC